MLIIFLIPQSTNPDFKHIRRHFSNIKNCTFLPQYTIHASFIIYLYIIFRLYPFNSIHSKNSQTLNSHYTSLHFKVKNPNSSLISIPVDVGAIGHGLTWIPSPVLQRRRQEGRCCDERERLRIKRDLATKFNSAEWKTMEFQQSRSKEKEEDSKIQGS